MNRSVIIVLITGILNPAFAEDCPRIMDDEDRLACFDAARTCAAIQSGPDRLECFDKAYADDDSETGPVEFHASPEEFATKTTSDSHGDAIEATIVHVTRNVQKIDFLQLDNGHVWRENEDRRVRFRPGQKVRIEEGIFGSFNLTVDGTKKTVKVKRVR